MFHLPRIVPAILLHAGHNAALLLIERSGHSAAFEGVPPLAALAIGALGLAVIIITRRAPARS